MTPDEPPTTSPSNVPPRPAPAAVLAYRVPAEDVKPVRASVITPVAVIVGMMLFGSVPLSLAFAYGSQWTWLVFTIPALLLGFIIAAVLLHRRGTSKSLVLGIWLGIGLALLGQGLCWGIIALS